MLGSIDANTGSPDLGWDTDQFPMDVKAATMIMKTVIEQVGDYCLYIQICLSCDVTGLMKKLSFLILSYLILPYICHNLCLEGSRM